MATSIKRKNQRGNGATKHAPALPGQVVLVMQGGGALGAYQVGVYQALHEAGVEPDWVIGTSIGAINASLIVGNLIERRLDRLLEFWAQVEHSDWQSLLIVYRARFSGHKVAVKRRPS